MVFSIKKGTTHDYIFLIIFDIFSYPSLLFLYKFVGETFFINCNQNVLGSSPWLFPNGNSAYEVIK